MKIINDVKFLIVGLGLIGGSYAQALTDLGYEVGAITRSQSSIDYALKNNLIAHGTTKVEKEYISKFDVIVFALYPKVLVKWIEENQSCFKKGALLTDVTGVKSPIVYKIQDILRSDIEFVGAHPMAGKEVYGVENADKSIFRNANYIVTPTAKNTKEAIDECKQLGKILGFKTVAELSPEKHDEMWSELFLMNKTELLSQMDLFMDKFKSLRDSIENDDREKMKEIMRLSTKRRSLFDKK